jgi:guanylate kinase
MQGNLIIVSAPSGAGKTTLVARTLERIEGVLPSISYTARPPRPGEEDAAHYHFVTRAEFERMIARGEFLEWAEVHGNLYGTSRRFVNEQREAGFDVVLTIDVQCAATCRCLFPEAIGVVILPPSRAVLEARLEGRGANQGDDLRVRIANARTELSEYRYFDYLVINDDIDQAIGELVAIIRAERCSRERRAAIVERILKDFDKEEEGNKR